MCVGGLALRRKKKKKRGGQELHRFFPNSRLLRASTENVTVCVRSVHNDGTVVGKRYQKKKISVTSTLSSKNDTMLRSTSEQHRDL